MQRTIQRRAYSTDAPTEMLTIKQVSRYLNIGEGTVKRWIDKGMLEAITLPYGKGRTTRRVKRSIVNNILNGTLILEESDND